MAEVLSTAIANVEASPQVRNQPWEGPREVYEAVGHCVTSATQAQDDVIRFCRIPSNARVSQLQFSAAAGTSGATDFGIYNSNKGDDGVVVDRDLFASAVLVVTGWENADLTHESGEYTFAEAEKPLWEVLGLAKDPNKWYDVCGAVSTVWVGGPISSLLKVRYTV